MIIACMFFLISSKLVTSTICKVSLLLFNSCFASFINLLSISQIITSAPDSINLFAIPSPNP